MKRICALLLVLATLFAFASCGISDDPSEIKALLKENNYDVLVLNSKKEFEDYDVKEILDFLDISFDGIDTLVIAMTREDDDKPIAVAFCEDKESAKAIEKELVYLLEDDEMTDEIFEEIFDETADADVNDYEIFRSGTVVCIGHKDTVKIIK